MKSRLFLASLLCSLPLMAQADSGACPISMTVQFFEGAPVDRFVLSNTGSTDISKAELQFDLRPSAGRLIFDTQSGGAGVEVFQPFKSADATLDVADGAEGLRMPLNGLTGGTTTSFTIDVDDRLTSSELGQIRVSGSEMEGAVVTISLNGDQYLAVFGRENTAVFGTGCSGSA
jgi:hypothetical protein